MSEISEPDVHADVLAVISSTLLDIVTMLRKIEERLGHLESLMGMSQEPKWSEVEDNADIEGDVSEDLVEHYQSLQKRTWDPVGQKWIYLPEPE
jgi:hypothetical protein